MRILGLNLIDVGVIVLYFGAMLYIGWRAMQKVKGQEDFFLGGRSFGKFLQTFSMFGQGTSAESAVSMSSLVAQKGLAGVFFSTLNGLATLPMQWFSPLWLRRSRLMTLADLFAERFQSRRLASLYAIAQVCFFVLVAGMGLQAMSKTVMAVAAKPVTALTQSEKLEYAHAMRLKELESKPADLLSGVELQEMKDLRLQAPRSHFSYFNKTILIISIALFVVVYAAGGGLEAAVWTDAVQSIFILILTVLLFPFAMVKLNSLAGNSGFVGAFRAVHHTLPAAMLELFGSPKLAGFTWYYMILLTLVGMAGMLAYANNLVVSGAARSEAAARAGSLNGIILKRVSTVFWAILALFILTLYGANFQDPDLLWGAATKDLLPVGLLGLMLSCLMAALMSTADTHMVVVSGLITRNLYRPLVKGKQDGHYLKMGRLFGLVYIVGGVLVALYSTSNLFEMFVYMMLINATMGPTILMAFLWRRTNTVGVWVSMGGALLMTLFIPLGVSMIPSVRYNTALQTEIQPPEIQRKYIAKEWDVKTRQKQIEQWRSLAAVGKARGECPASLHVGEEFTQSFVPPAKAIYWKKGIREDREGRLYGNGLFRVELYLMHLCGLDPSKYSVATIESISLLFKLVFPFAMLLLFGFLAPQNDDEVCDRFYARLLTPVQPDHEADARAVMASMDNPASVWERKLWPKSSWYVRRWDWQDWKGVLISAVAVVAIGALMLVLAQLGS